MSIDDFIIESKKASYLPPSSRIYEEDICKYLLDKYGFMSLNLTLSKSRPKYFEGNCVIAGKVISVNFSYELTKQPISPDGIELNIEYLKNYRIDFGKTDVLFDFCNLINENQVYLIFEKSFKDISHFYKNINLSFIFSFNFEGVLDAFYPANNYTIRGTSKSNIYWEDQADLIVYYYLFFFKNKEQSILNIKLGLLKHGNIQERKEFLADYRNNKLSYFKLLEIMLYE